MNRNRSLFYCVDARQAIIETIAVQAVLVLGWLFITQFPFAAGWRENLFHILYYPCGILWCAVRWRWSRGARRWWQNLFSEFVMAAVLSLFSLQFVAGLDFVAGIWGVKTVFVAGHIPYTLVVRFHVTLLALANGGIFLLCRMWLRLLYGWERMRRTYLRWALTHALLLVCIGGVALFTLFFIAMTQVRTSGNPLDLVFTLLFMLFITTIVLIVVSPPAALFSYLFARKTTRRIETLLAATSALRAGDYHVRVNVEGEDEVARLQGNFNAMAADLERAMHELQAERDNVTTLLQARRELIASVSHELRTPVATVRGYLESTLAAWDDRPSPTLRQDLTVMEQQAIRLQSLIDDLFTLARAEVGRLEMRCVPTDIAQVARRVVETMAPLAWRSSKIEMVAEIACSQVPCANVDVGRLEQILQNLLHNGVRHTPPGGIVVVHVTTEDDAVVLQVKDTGEGISENELPHIWERFYRTENSRKQFSSGTGLGLAIVKELTEAMGGVVRVESILGEGTCFTISLPYVARSTGDLKQPDGYETLIDMV
jgi:signal transduction histidine kinase